MLDEEARRTKEHDMHLRELNRKAEEPKKTFP